MASYPTFHECVFSNHRKEDGTYNVKIRITFKRKDRKLPTNVFVTKEQLTRSLKIKDQSVLDKLDALKMEFRSIVSRIDIFLLDAMDVDDVIEFIRMEKEKEKPFLLDFFVFAEEAILTKNSRYNYRGAVKALKDFVGKDDMDISEITSSLMKGFEAYLRKKYGNTARAVSLYTSSIAHIHKLARDKYNQEEFGSVRIRNPFDYYTPPRQLTSVHRNVDISIIRKMMEQRSILKGQQRIAIDAYIISFALMGTNIPDLFGMEKEKDGILTYCRTKTKDRRADKALMKVRIEDAVRNIVDEYKDDELQFTFHRSYSNYRCLGKAANQGLASWCKANGLDKITFYSARHTWATTAYSLGINPSIITDALNHIDNGRRIDFIYINKDWRIIWDANKKVLDFVLGCQESPDGDIEP